MDVGRKGIGSEDLGWETSEGASVGTHEMSVGSSIQVCKHWLHTHLTLGLKLGIGAAEMSKILPLPSRNSKEVSRVGTQACKNAV